MTTDAEVAAKKRRHRKERIIAAVVIVLLVGVTFAVRWWSRSEERQVREDFRYIPRETKITPEILLLRDYVRIDTSTVEGAAAGARWLVAELARRGVAAELIAAPEGRLNVYVRIKGRRPGNALLLFNHIDVVPPGEGWTKPPFEAQVEVGQMYGRGTLDMKALAICQLVAVADVAKSRRPPEHDLVFLATADEETGSQYGMKWLLEHRPDVFEGVTDGITEGGVTEVITEQITYFGIEVGSKQLVSFSIVGKDRESLEKARIALEPYFGSREAGRILPEVREYFRGLAPTRSTVRPILEDIEAAVARGESWKLPVSYRDLTQNTMWVSAPFRNGETWTMNVRQANLPDEQPQERIAFVAGIVAPMGARIGAIEHQEGPVPFSKVGTPVFRLLADQAQRQYGAPAGPQILYRSLSDARFLRTRGINCYGVAPYRVDYFQSISIHKRDERIRLDWYVEGIAYMRSVVERWARTQ